jgi:hypothetical protein
MNTPFRFKIQEFKHSNSQNRQQQKLTKGAIACLPKQAIAGVVRRKAEDACLSATIIRGAGMKVAL